MSSKQPEDRVYFFDRSIGKHKVATAVRDSGRRVIIHDDEFEPSTPDEDWLPVVGQKNWIVVTKDMNIRYRENEIAALETARVRMFVLSSGNMTGDEMARAVVLALPGMERMMNRRKGPFLAGIDRNGRVRLIWDSHRPKA